MRWTLYPRLFTAGILCDGGEEINQHQQWFCDSSSPSLHSHRNSMPWERGVDTAAWKTRDGKPCRAVSWDTEPRGVQSQEAEVQLIRESGLTAGFSTRCCGVRHCSGLWAPGRTGSRRDQQRENCSEEWLMLCKLASDKVTRQFITTALHRYHYRSDRSL